MQLGLSRRGKRRPKPKRKLICFVLFVCLSFFFTEIRAAVRSGEDRHDRTALPDRGATPQDGPAHGSAHPHPPGGAALGAARRRPPRRWPQRLRHRLNSFFFSSYLSLSLSMIIYIFGAIQLENRFHPPPSQYGKSKKKTTKRIE